MVSRGCGEGQDEELVLNDYRVSVLQDENSGDGWW